MPKAGVFWNKRCVLELKMGEIHEEFIHRSSMLHLVFIQRLAAWQWQVYLTFITDRMRMTMSAVCSMFHPDKQWIKVRCLVQLEADRMTLSTVYTGFILTKTPLLFVVKRAASSPCLMAVGRLRTVPLYVCSRARLHSTPKWLKSIRTR